MKHTQKSDFFCGSFQFVIPRDVLKNNYLKFSFDNPNTGILIFLTCVLDLYENFLECGRLLRS